jgi:hypothetical protein
MVKLLANAAAALTLLLSTSLPAPAWSAEKPAGAKCPYAKHKQAKRTPVAAKPQPVRGVTLVEHRKMDVQILSFGP